MSTPNAKSGGSGLKKTGFTPSVRIGLSRKIKTPSVGTPIRDDHNSVGVETPQKCIKTAKRTLGMRTVIKTPETPVIRKALENRKSETPQKIIKSPEPKSETKLDLPVIKNVPDHENLEVTVGETPNRLQRKSAPVNKESQKSNNKKKLELKNENFIKECTVRLDIENKPAVLVTDSKQNIPSPKKSGREIRKPVKRLSMKKSSTSEDLSDEDFNTTKSSSSNSQVEVFKGDSEKKEQAVCKPKRRRVVLSSSEDEDFVTSQGSSKAKAEKDLRIKVQELSKIIQQKSLRLHDLQQASVYRNLHKVKNLDELTLKWKNGCEDAVRILHKNLQGHSPISMLSLLEKLRVPSEFLSYNTDNDVFS